MSTHVHFADPCRLNLFLMSHGFDEFADGRIDKINKDGGCHG